MSTNSAKILFELCFWRAASTNSVSIPSRNFRPVDLGRAVLKTERSGVVEKTDRVRVLRLFPIDQAELQDNFPTAFLG